MIIKETATAFIAAPEGTHIARCFAVIELGTQLPGNPSFAPARKVMLGFELPNETVVRDGVAKPLVIWKEYNASLSEKATLRKHLQGWRGRAFSAEELQGFQLEKILGAPALITIIHKRSQSGSTRGDIETIARPPANYPCPPPVTPKLFFEIPMGNGQAFINVPEWLQKKIVSSPEWADVVKTHTQVAPQAPAAPVGGPNAVVTGEDVPEDFPQEEDDQIPF